MRTTVLCIAVLTTACHPSGAPATTLPTGSPSTLDVNATMVRDVDGDTIDVTVGHRRERVRLIGIDTPETKKPNTPVQCYGPEATKFTTSLLPADSRLHLERDVVARDVYGRLLAYVYLVGDGTFVNLKIIRQGYARPLPIPPNVAHAGEFVEAARLAEADNIGLWARCSG
ncbi:MAG: thermonuclease family protein [Ilumatobacteraceae bacterium]